MQRCSDSVGILAELQFGISRHGRFGHRLGYSTRRQFTAGGLQFLLPRGPFADRQKSTCTGI